MKRRVTGIGGIFFKAKDPESLGKWYKKHLGIPVEGWGGCAFPWRLDDNPRKQGQTIWSPFPADTKYFKPGRKSFMVNFRVDDLHGVLKALRKEGVDVDKRVEESEYGKFGWIMDPDGTRIELWEPPPPPKKKRKARAK